MKGPLACNHIQGVTKLVGWLLTQTTSAERITRNGALLYIFKLHKYKTGKDKIVPVLN
jgi:hypothetical protein